MSLNQFMTAPGRSVRLTALAVAIAVGVGAAGPVLAQSTTGAIFGSAPMQAGETVLIEGASGVTREVPVDAKGRYAASSLPLGTYTVSLRQNGAVVDSRKDVSLTVGGGVQVSFASPAATANATSLASVAVTANTLPSIDVSQVDSRTVITSQQLAKLPLQRTAEAVALLAPGASLGASAFTGPTGERLDSFGGSSVAENAYYINGFNTSDPLHNFGGLSLPYGAIDQEQVLTGGYGAEYGRSDGGVINLVGKRGTNEWHFGGQVLWTPGFAESDPSNTYFPSGSQYLSNTYRADGIQQGQIYQYRKNNNKAYNQGVGTYTEDAYVGGPLIKDKLFFFAAVEGQQSPNNKYVQPVGTNTETKSQYTDPKWYGKIDWNINDSNILELTGASSKQEYQGNNYVYTYTPGDNKGVKGAYLGGDTSTKDGADMWVAKYTGYITDALTVEAMYGKMTETAYSQAPGYNPNYNYIDHSNLQNPAYGSGITGPQSIEQINDPGDHDKTTNYRFDITYKLGSHTLRAGIDNLNTSALDIGTEYSGPGEYLWNYGKGDPNTPISAQPGSPLYVGAPGGQGYYVGKVVYTNSASVRVAQRAQYLEDSWQVTNNFLLNLGIRNDQFTNYNPNGVPYLNLHRPNWSPRLGASWDVYGDSSFKVYANAGRYYLDEPANVAIRGAAASSFYTQYFTYTGIDPTTGVPTGLTQIPQGHYPGVSANNEYGVAPDPKEVTTKNAKAEYQDEYILGFDKSFTMFGEPWTYGAKATYRNLRNDLDDFCDQNVIESAAAAEGIDPVAALGSSGCYIMNPGKALKVNVTDANAPSGYTVLDIPWSATGQPSLKRKYYALDLYLEHPFDGKWYGKVTYEFSRSYGNTEGSVRSDIGQTDVSQTEDWDNAGVMTYANGYQSNNHTHTLKFYGYYQITPEWMVGADILIQSGTPKECLGYFGPDGVDSYNYGASYHYCDGLPDPFGSKGNNPWVDIVSVNGEYRPEWAGHKLAFTAKIYNIFNQQRVLQYNDSHETGPGATSAVIDPNYNVPTAYSQPRYLQLGVTYDF